MDRPFLTHRDQKTQIVAGDGCHLRELLHPASDGLPINYSLAYAYVEPGERTLDHRLGQSEVYYIIAGSGTMVLDDERYAVRTGSCYFIPAGCRQWLCNEGATRLEFLCIVDPPWSPEGEEVLEAPAES